jgi:dATP pyrophosphohydrolase
LGEGRFKLPQSVLVVIYTTQGEVLMLERREPSGFWQSVTGSLRPGETPRAAAVREVAEETGLVASENLVDCHHTNRFPILPAWRHRYAPEVTENVEHLFLLEIAADTPIQLNPDEHLNACWLPAKEAAERATSYTNHDAIVAFVSAGKP